MSNKRESRTLSTEAVRPIMPAFEQQEPLSGISRVQEDRRKWNPHLPQVLRAAAAVSPTTASISVAKEDEAILEKLFPNTWQQSAVMLVPAPLNAEYTPLRVGVILSGGQAPGGHNVISGVFDYIKSCNPNSQLFGFLNGPYGVFKHKYMEISEEYMNKYRNQGGFDMICSGRHKIEDEDQKQASLQICKKLDLHGIIIIGGDDSNTNGAVLADYFKGHDSPTKVIGVPKTIDGDLKNEVIEVSFGFDTAVKVFAEMIGNLATDVATSQNRYHFVRLMGRSASNISLECTLQTRPNLSFIGEEVQEQKRSLASLVDEIADMVISRHKLGKNYGLVLVPEGLIEFIPEVGLLIRQINDILAEGPFEMSKLSAVNRAVFESLPVAVSQDLLLERDPHGNVQVSRVATEKLLLMMTQSALEKRDPICASKFIPTSHFFGYEGRAALPSNFDANYCYALGHTAGALVANGVTACMSFVKNLHLPAKQWIPGGCPIMRMMNIERRKGKDVPVIKKYLVDLNGPLFQSFKKVRDAWKINDYYRNPGPIQFKGPASDLTNSFIVAPTIDDLLPPKPSDYDTKRCHFAKSLKQLSPLQQERLNHVSMLNPALKVADACLQRAQKCFPEDQQITAFVSRAFPLQVKQGRFTSYNLTERSSTMVPVKEVTGPLRIGVALCGQQTPGISNVVLGLVERMNIETVKDGKPCKRGTVIGFKGIAGLMDARYIEVERKDLDLYINQGGFELLGRTEEAKGHMRTQEGMDKVVQTCKKLKLHGLVMIGGQTTLSDAAILTEAMLGYEHKNTPTDAPPTCIIGVPASQENNVKHPLVETTLGFDSTSKTFAALVGNLQTDAASATKYWYFVRLMGQTPSHIVLESALQTHPNVTVVSEKYASEDETLQGVVQDIADVICARADEDKNFGTVLVPEGLIHHLPQLRQLINEVASVFQTVMEEKPEDLPVLEKEFVHFETATTKRYQSVLTPWSLALLKSLPEFFREQLVKRTPSGRIELSEVGTEQLLSVLVSHEIKRRKQAGMYNGSFAPLCHYFGFQGRSAMPSEFDCALGLAHGYLAGIQIECGLTGYMNSIRGLCGPPSTWRMSSIPIATLLRVMPGPEMKKYGRQVPMVPLGEVDLAGNAYKAYRNVSEKWEITDSFANPGPIQFNGVYASYLNRTIREEHADYLVMLKQMESLTNYLREVCSFGVDAYTLKTTVMSLENLMKIIDLKKDYIQM